MKSVSKYLAIVGICVSISTVSVGAQSKIERIEDELSSSDFRDGDIKFDHEAIIREFATGDTAALFAVLASKEGLEITDVVGPKFLGDAHVGILNESVLEKLFTHSSVPLPQSERQRLIEKYQGASVIYFEGYQGRLCNGQTFQVTANGKLDSRKTKSNFQFSAVPKQGDSCQFAILAATTQY